MMRRGSRFRRTWGWFFRGSSTPPPAGDRVIDGSGNLVKDGSGNQVIP